MKIKIVDEKGKVAGWSVAFVATGFYMIGNIVLPFIPVASEMAVGVIEKIGFQMNVSYATIVGFWFTKQAIKTFQKGGPVTFEQMPKDTTGGA